MKTIKTWIDRYFSNPDAVLLTMILVGSILVLMTMGSILAPVIASVVLAYLLDWLVKLLEKCKFPHVFAVTVVFTLSLGLVFLALFVLFPLLGRQLTNLVQEFPQMLVKAQAAIMQFPQQYPEYISITQVQHLLNEIKSDLGRFGQLLLSFSLASIPGAVILVVYLVLVPLLVFFFLKDGRPILTWFGRYLPRRRKSLQQIWQEVNSQIGNYVRGKVIEIIIVSVVTYIAFAVLDLRYAILLSVAVGLSVIIPYIGAIVVTVPVLLIGYLQWGWTPHFIYLLIVYIIILALDANLLVPLLFAEVVNLHPVAIILAILFFGAIWGFWGVFFAIPLASVVKALIDYWPVKVK